MGKKFVVDANPNGIPNEKTGTLFTAFMHIFCGIVGAGVLALPRSVAWLGWIAGPILIILFWLISILTSFLLADAYEVNGVEHGRYHHAVRNILGPRYAIGVSVCQIVTLFLATIAYTITAVTSMVSIAQMHCNGAGITNCFNQTWKLSLIFGAAEILLSQVPSLEEVWWVSILGVVTALIYSTIALVMGCKHAGARQGTIGGIPATDANKAFGILSSIGAIAFAYNFSLILLEIQDTLRQPPKASKTMKPASALAITGSFAFYFIVAVTNYSAYGNDVNGFILNAYPGPTWVLMLGQVCIMLHMLAAYQVFGQPVFNTLESHLKSWALRRTGSRSHRGRHDGVETVRRPSHSPHAPPSKVDDIEGKPGTPADAEEAAGSLSGPLQSLRRASAQLGRLSARSSMYRVSTGFTNEAVPLNDEHHYVPLWQRIIVRTLYVCITTLLAIIMPFFGDIAGLVGAISFFPLSVFFPIHCWRRLYKVGPRFNVLLWAVEIGVGLACVAAIVGSIRNIITAWSTYKIFGD